METGTPIIKVQSGVCTRVCKRYNRDKFEEWLKQLDFESLSMQMQDAEKGVEISDRTLYLRKYHAWLQHCADVGGATVCEPPEHFLNKRVLARACANGSSTFAHHCLILICGEPAALCHADPSDSFSPRLEISKPNNISKII